MTLLTGYFRISIYRRTITIRLYLSDVISYYFVASCSITHSVCQKSCEKEKARAEQEKARETNL